MKRALAAALTLLWAAPAGAQDHPLLSPYAGSELAKRDIREYDEFSLPLGPLFDDRFSKSQRLEGKLSHFEYKNPPERSTLEIMRSYEGALKQAGFETLFRCDKKDCGRGGTHIKYFGFFCPGCGENAERYLAAKRSGPDGDVHVALFVSEYSKSTFLNVLESKPMDSGNVKVGAAAKAAETPKASNDAISTEPPPSPSKGKSTGGAQIETAVVKSLNGLGLQARTSGGRDSADIIVSGSVETSPLKGDGSAWKWARSNATISAQDAKTGKTFLRFDASWRASSSQSYEEAVRLSRAKLGAIVTEKVHAGIVDYFENQ